MRTFEMNGVDASRPRLAPGDVDLSRALTQGLDTPLAALRATMESLQHELHHARSEHVQPLRLEGVMREVDLLGKNVRELCDFASPPVPRPLSCSLDEIVQAALAPLSLEQRRRVVAARSESGARLQVDGPLLASCLRRLIENALEASGELALVVTRLEGDQATFTVVDDAPSALVAGWQPSPFRTTKPNHLGLGLTLTQRDVGLLGGRLEFRSEPGGRTSVRITIPSKERAR